MADLGSSSAPPASQPRRLAPQASSSSSSSSSRRPAVAPSSFEPSTLLEPLQRARAQFSKLSPNEKAVASAVAACAGTVLVFQGYRKWWRRVRTVDHVLPRMLEGRTWVRGVVTRSVPYSVPSPSSSSYRADGDVPLAASATATASACSIPQLSGAGWPSGGSRPTPKVRPPELGQLAGALVALWLARADMTVARRRSPERDAQHPDRRRRRARGRALWPAGAFLNARASPSSSPRARVLPG